MTDMTDKLAGEVIRAARQQRGYTYRQVDDLTSALQQQDPQRFERVPKTVMWNMETGGETFFLKRSVSPGKIRAVIEILFSGDALLFQRETGLSVIDVQTGVADDRAALEVPMYLEMESPRVSHRFSRAPVPCDFVVEVRTGRMSPVLTHGQPLYCIRADAARPGEIAVINMAGDGLTIATALPGGRYRFERNQREFTAAEGDSLFGIVTWLKPTLPV